MKEAQKPQVLCPIEFDVSSLAALDLACDLVRRNNGTLHVLHVVSPPSPALISAPLLFERVGQFARIELEEIARESLGDVDYRLLVKTGRAPDEIIATASELKAHVIVMATHAHTGAPRPFLGSVAEKVIREAPCPVLTIRRALACESSCLHPWRSLAVRKFQER
jgi:universal stress protein A